MQVQTTKPIILLVEDSEDDAFFFQRALKKLGFPGTCVHLANGQAAIDFLLRARVEGNLPDLIFLDLKMPGVNGFEFLEWLNKQSFDPALRVVVLSGSDHAADMQLSRELGAREYVVKPMMPDQLTSVLATFRIACALKVAA
jgi:CheY-like chemotaxis protein